MSASGAGTSPLLPPRPEAHSPGSPAGWASAPAARPRSVVHTWALCFRPQFPSLTLGRHAAGQWDCVHERSDFPPLLCGPFLSFPAPRLAAPGLSSLSPPFVVGRLKHLCSLTNSSSSRGPCSALTRGPPKRGSLHSPVPVRKAETPRVQRRTRTATSASRAGSRGMRHRRWLQGESHTRRLGREHSAAESGHLGIMGNAITTCPSFCIWCLATLGRC